MAEINIERSGSRVSLWIAVLLLALSLFIGWILISDPTGGAGAAGTDSTSTSSAVTSEGGTGSVDVRIAADVTAFLQRTPNTA